MTTSGLRSFQGAPAALLLIDVINEFFDLAEQFYFPEAPAVLPAILKLLSAARSAGALVVHARERHEVAEPNAELRKLPPHSLAGSRAIEPPEGAQARAGEPVLFKRRYSCFFATALDLVLREHNISTLVLAGVKTNVCVRATAQDAFAYGYQVLVPQEAVSSNRPHLHQASLEDIDRYLGKVVTVEEAVRALGGQ